MIKPRSEPALCGKTEGVWSFLPGEDKAQETSPSIPVTKGQLRRGWWLALHREPHRDDKGQQVRVACFSHRFPCIHRHMF